MTTYVISYDIKKTTPDPYSEFLNQAEKVGWKVWIWAPSVKKWYRLPNTTLVGDFQNRDAAHRAFNTAVANTSAAIGVTVTVEKFFLAAYSESLFNSDFITAG
ncbi:hypothetical protein ASD52_01970 [Ensifer sp. Root142]|uniref:hypothetical protein n=1 Tax=Ensifer sp. Root142 TaxID=1736461 RepID=UPI00070A8D46|nr:hypothetical protein [Ensifer sp. Root142]KQY78636.1 hypothetical protein ASD52_01970 [Ensifer sp. Root142]